MAYDLDGIFTDFCSCGEQCYCQPQGARDGDDCQAVNAWHIERGTVGDTDVSGLTLVALSQVHGHVIAGRSIAYFVEQQATDAQRDALWKAWSGKLGGPLADFVHLTGEIGAVERAPISFNYADGQGTLQVGDMMAADLQAPAAGSEAYESGGDICTATPSSQRGTGATATFRRLALGEGRNISMGDTRAVYGRFHFEG